MDDLDEMVFGKKAGGTAVGVARGHNVEKHQSPKDDLNFFWVAYTYQKKKKFLLSGLHRTNFIVWHQGLNGVDISTLGVDDTQVWCLASLTFVNRIDDFPFWILFSLFPHICVSSSCLNLLHNCLTWYKWRFSMTYLMPFGLHICLKLLIFFPIFWVACFGVDFNSLSNSLIMLRHKWLVFVFHILPTRH